MINLIELGVTVTEDTREPKLCHEVNLISSQKHDQENFVVQRK